jgi:hypothetical protein
VTSVLVTANGATVGSASAGPYAFSWNTTSVANGSYTLTATARDAAGNTKSTSVSVSVNNNTPDTQAPAVAITSPAGGATLTGTVNIQVAASDNVGVTSVIVAANGAQIGSLAVARTPLPWNTTAVPNGAYTLAATARDAAGNSRSVALTSPLSGSSLKDGTVTFRVSWTGALSTVAYYCDGVLVASGSSAPFSSTWKMGNLPKGSHSLQAKAYDQAGASAVSGIVYVTR